MNCSSLWYQVQQEQQVHPCAALVTDEDLHVMDEMLDLAQTTTVPLLKPPQNGHGVFVFASNDRYAGEFKAGKMDGRGIFLFSDGSMYRGEFQDGFMHGRGVLVYCDGTKYEGNFAKSKRNGKGTATFGTTGNMYTGDWKDDQPHGEGEFESFCDFHSTNSVILAGEKFKGSYTNGKRSGVGTCTYFNGDVLTCKWDAGKCVEYDSFQRHLLTKSGNVVCLSCALNNASSSQFYGYLGPTIAAVFAHERPLFQHCIRLALQQNLRLEVFSDVLGSASFLSFSGSGCVLFSPLLYLL
jgi:hypothetical protein